VLPGVGDVEPDRVKGSVETYDAGGGRLSAQAHGTTKHRVVTGEEKGLVSDPSKQQVKAGLHDVIDEREHAGIRSRPNTRTSR
jgi:hypothetical protein